MRVCLLGDKAAERLPSIIYDHFPDMLSTTSEPLTQKLIENTDVFVSYGYKHIITKEMLSSMKRPPVNLHISLLPWNRGADPNFWSWLDDTPKGVSIHLMDGGVDTGPLIAQDKFFAMRDTTLKETYIMLCLKIEMLFENYWPFIRMNDFVLKDQIGVGTVHKKSDLNLYKPFLELKGWDTPVREVATWK